MHAHSVILLTEAFNQMEPLILKKDLFIINTGNYHKNYNYYIFAQLTHGIAGSEI